MLRNILVIDNLEEKLFVPVDTGHLLNMCHFRMVVKSVAKFHAVSLTYKKTLFETFLSQSAAAKATRKADEVDMGEHKVATGRIGLFARFPFLKVISATTYYFTIIFQPLWLSVRTFMHMYRVARKYLPWATEGIQKSRGHNFALF